MTSPGTNDSTLNSCTWPSRSALICCGSNPRSASSARSARYSCQNEKTPLTRMTPTIATPSGRMPWPGSRCSAKKASAAATQRMIAKKWVNSRAKRSHNGVPGTASTRFGPNSCWRRAASISLNPAVELLRLARAWSAVRPAICAVCSDDSPNAAGRAGRGWRGAGRLSLCGIHPAPGRILKFHAGGIVSRKPFENGF